MTPPIFRPPNPVLEEILRTQEVWKEDGTRLPLHSHVSPEQGEMLDRLVRELDPTTTLEVGVGYGISAMYICDALNKREETKHFCMDPAQDTDWWDNIGILNIKRAGYESIVDFRPHMSIVALPQIMEEGYELDFALIDGWHTFDHALVDFFLIDAMLRVGGVVVFDDTQWPGVHKAARYVVTNRAYSVVECLPSPTRHELRFPWVRRSIVKAAERSSALSKLLRAELSRPDDAIGLLHGSRCIALRKEAHDTRECFDHEAF